MKFIRIVPLASALGLFFSLPPVYAETLSLDSYLDSVRKTSEDIRAVEIDIRSLEAEIDARDLELSPILDLELNRFSDDRENFSTNNEIKGRSAALSITQPLASGTRLSLLSESEILRFKTAPGTNQYRINWEAGITQSLWQNSFGHQTALRRRRDQNELRGRFLQLTLEREQLLIDFESFYWDIAYSQEELAIRQENLKRSERILSWIRDRFARAAAERTDLLQGEALVSSRELQLQIASDRLKTLQSQLKERLPFEFDIVPDQADLRKERSLSSLVARAGFAPPVPALIDALKAQYESDLLMAEAKLAKDKLKPILDIGYTYGRQGADGSASIAREEARSKNNDYHEVGVVFAAPLSFSLISKSRRAFEANAEAQRFRSIRLQRQSTLQWNDLERTTREQKDRVKTAMKLARFQKEKSEEERARYQKGRTTAFQAITFEQEAAESELLVLQLLVQLRRTESLARTYIQHEPH